jgi:hypothetical protein
MPHRCPVWKDGSVESYVMECVSKTEVSKCGLCGRGMSAATIVGACFGAVVGFLCIYMTIKIFALFVLTKRVLTTESVLLAEKMVEKKTLSTLPARLRRDQAKTMWSMWTVRFGYTHEGDFRTLDLQRKGRMFSKRVYILCWGNGEPALNPFGTQVIS